MCEYIHESFLRQRLRGSLPFALRIPGSDEWQTLVCHLCMVMACALYSFYFWPRVALHALYCFRKDLWFFVRLPCLTHCCIFKYMCEACHVLVGRGTKTQNFPDSSFLRAKTFRTKRVNTLLATYKKCVNHLLRHMKKHVNHLSRHMKVDSKTFRTILTV